MNELQTQQNFANIVIHNNKADYSLEEFLILEKAYNSLEEKAQGGVLSKEETRIRVAFMRYKQEENFKIYQPTPSKAKGRTKKATSVDDLIADLSGEERQKKPKASRKKKEDSPEQAKYKKAAQLLAMQERGEILSEEDEKFLFEMINGDSLEVL